MAAMLGLCVSVVDTDHPRSTIIGLSDVLKFLLDPICIFADIAIFYISALWLELAYSGTLLGVLGVFPR